MNRSCSQNSTTCELRLVDVQRFPSHVADLRLHALRPLLLQQVLDQTGAAVWIDVEQVLAQEAGARLKAAVAAADAGPGVRGWTVEQPTSALTHPGMFPFFQTEKGNFFFHRMLDPSCLLLLNTPRVHQHLMLPWIRCVLQAECISPIGAQSSGCRFDKKPLYRYSGCHFYDMSALNVALGLMFDFDARPYAGSDADRLCSKASSLVSLDSDLTAERELDSSRRRNASATKLSFNSNGWRISSE